MSGLTPKKKEELKQMMGKYSGKVCLSLLSMEEREHDFMRMQYADEEFKCSKYGVNRDDLGWITKL